MTDIIKNYTFDEWIYEVTEHLATKALKVTAHDIYQMINLTDAKLAFVDGMEPEKYRLA